MATKVSRNDAWAHSDFVRIENPTLEDFLVPERMFILCRQAREEFNRECEPQVRALIAAGWIAEPLRADLEPWQWYWRAPKKRTWTKGRLYLSTQQAFNALQKGKA